MEIFKILLAIHIVGGSISLLLGLYILLTKKGNKIHKKVGKIYFISMLTASIIAMPMSYLHPHYFLFIISIFTSYMLLTGTRYLAKKSIEDINKIDWSITASMLIFSLAFIIFGINLLIKSNTFGVVFLVFGSISMLFVRQDWINYTGKSKMKNYFLTTHIQRMMGSYIASCTAFLVVNNTILPSVIAWLLPTIILSPLISFWTKKYFIKK